MSAANPVANPGSIAARAIGCACPVLDNGHGRGGGVSADGSPAFWITEGCPVHAPAPAPRDSETIEMFDCAGGDAFDGDPSRILGQATI